MDLIPSTIIFFIGFSLLGLSHAEPPKFPDEGRLKAGACFSKGLHWQTDQFIELQDHLLKFCEETRINVTHIQVEIKTNDLDAENVYDTIKQCLNDSGLDLITRYKNNMPDSVKSIDNDSLFPEINQVAVGLCEETEVIQYGNLNEDDKTKCANCLKGCAEDLFRKFESIFKALKMNYEKPVEIEGKDSPMSISVPEKYELTVSVDQYDKTCKKFVITELDTLDIVGKDYIEKYITQLDNLYENGPVDVEKKDLVFASAESYFACTRWKCAIANESDVPMSEIIEWTIQKKSQDNDDLVKNWRRYER